MLLLPSTAELNLKSILEEILEVCVCVIVLVSSIIVETAKSPFNALLILSLIVSCEGSESIEIGVLSTSYSFSEISAI